MGPLASRGTATRKCATSAAPGGIRPPFNSAAPLPGIAFVDRVAVAVELVGAVEVRSRLHRSLAIFGDIAAPEHDAPGGVGGLEFQPDVERIHRPARKKVTDLARAH